MLASHPLIAADVTYVESNVMELLAEAGYSDLERAKRLASGGLGGGWYRTT